LISIKTQAPPAAMQPEPYTTLHCYHCGQPVPRELSLSVVIDGVREPMCCAGCQAVAETIIGYGLGNFYRFRTGASAKPEALAPADLFKFEIYDDRQFQSTFTTAAADGSRTAHLLLEGVVCPACAWLIESRLQRLSGLADVKVNYAAHRAAVTWREDQLTLGGILRTIHDLGYRAYPYDPGRAQLSLESERKAHLRRLGLAGLLGMQVMMFAIAVYVGDWTGMEAEYKSFFNWIGLLLTTPVMLYSARPFFDRAARDLKLLRPGMDVPVALGLLVAYGSSIVTTIAGTGPVYYDSVVMFVFLLLTARYFEFLARQRAMRHYDAASRIIPAVATRLDSQEDEARLTPVPVAKLKPGDRVLVKPGESICADGTIVQGSTTVDEAIITGEHLPVKKSVADPVIGGTTNLDSPIQVAITRIGPETVLAHVLKLAAAGQEVKPAVTRLTNRIATGFVIAVLLLAAIVALYWWRIDPARAVPVTIAVLVITCPCALSLATPVALTAAAGRLMSRGLVMVNNDALEVLNRATHFILDKTGTLTTGKLKVREIRMQPGGERERCLAAAAALESHSEHPIAKAILAAGDRAPSLLAGQVDNYPGRGIRGVVEGRCYYLGTEDFIREQTGHTAEPGATAAPLITRIVLADQTGIQCDFLLADELRPGARELISALHSGYHATLLLSGDAPEVVQSVAAELGITTFHARMTPAQKLERVEALIREGAVIIVIGDGINDAPVLARAHLSIAMGAGVDVAKLHADMILLNNDLDVLRAAVDLAGRTSRIIRQNLGWAIAYNLLAIPVAVTGLVAPWLAAVGMSLSSLIVAGNSMRLNT
jgi:Cu2+-exporting ATPase